MTRSLIILLLLGCFCNYTRAQLSADEKAVIHLAAGQGYHKHDFCYESASIPAWVVKITCNLIKIDTSLHLSASEIVEVTDKLHAAIYAQNWQNATLDSSEVVKESDIKRAGSSDIKDYVKKKYPNLPYYSFYQISTPVFIRDNTICFLYNIQFNACYNNDITHPNSEVCPFLEIVDMFIKKNNIWYRRRPSIFTSSSG